MVLLIWATLSVKILTSRTPSPKTPRPVFRGQKELSLGYFLDEVEADSSHMKTVSLITFHVYLGNGPFEERTIT